MRHYEYEMSMDDMPKFCEMGHDDLLNAAEGQWIRGTHAIRQLECAEKELDELTAANRALEAELRMARGEVKTVLNNTEEAKLKAEREREKYREYMEQPRDEAWERELRIAKESKDFWHDAYCELSRTVTDAVKVLNGRGKYVVAEVDDGR